MLAQALQRRRGRVVPVSVSKRLRGKTRGGIEAIAAGSDMTPSTTWEAEGSATIPADPNGRLFIYKVEGRVSGERDVLSSGINVFLGYSIEEVGDPAKTAPDATLASRNGVGALDCTNQVYNAGEVLLTKFASAFGKNFKVRLWAKYAAEQAGTATKICWTGVQVWYDEDVLVNTGVRQATMHQRRRA